MNILIQKTITLFFSFLFFIQSLSANSQVRPDLICKNLDLAAGRVSIAATAICSQAIPPLLEGTNIGGNYTFHQHDACASIINAAGLAVVRVQQSAGCPDFPNPERFGPYLDFDVNEYSSLNQDIFSRICTSLAKGSCELRTEVNDEICLKLLPQALDRYTFADNGKNNSSLNLFSRRKACSKIANEGMDLVVDHHIKSGCLKSWTDKSCQNQYSQSGAISSSPSLYQSNLLVALSSILTALIKISI